MDPALDLVLRAALALLLVVAAAHKLLDFERFRSTLADYRLVPAALVPAAALVVVGVELLLAVGLGLPGLRRRGLQGAAAVLVLYAGAIGVNLARGRRHIDCGCLGAAAHQGLSWWLVGRNLALAAAALAAARPVQGRALVWVDVLTVTGALGALSALHTAFDRLVANAPALGRARGDA